MHGPGQPKADNVLKKLAIFRKRFAKYTNEGRAVAAETFWLEDGSRWWGSKFEKLEINGKSPKQKQGEEHQPTANGLKEAEAEPKEDPK